jgi:hypothetical protein
VMNRDEVSGLTVISGAVRFYRYFFPADPLTSPKLGFEFDIASCSPSRPYTADQFGRI